MYYILIEVQTFGNVINVTSYIDWCRDMNQVLQTRRENFADSAQWKLKRPYVTFGTLEFILASSGHIGKTKI